MIIQEIQVKKKIKKTIAIYSTKYINKTSNKKKNEEKNRTQETLNRLVSQSHMNWENTKINDHKHQGQGK